MLIHAKLTVLISKVGTIGKIRGKRKSWSRETLRVKQAQISNLAFTRVALGRYCHNRSLVDLAN